MYLINIKNVCYLLLKTELMNFNQDGAISSLNGKPLKWGDQFTYLSSYISSTESHVNIHWGKTCTAINWLMNLWEYN